MPGNNPQKSFDEFAKEILAESPTDQQLSKSYEEIRDPVKDYVISGGSMKLAVTASGAQPGKVIFRLGGILGTGTNSTSQSGFGNFTGPVLSPETMIQGGTFSLTVVAGSPPTAILNLLGTDGNPVPGSPWQSTTGTQNGTIGTWYGNWE